MFGRTTDCTESNVTTQNLYVNDVEGGDENADTYNIRKLLLKPVKSPPQS